MVWMTPFFLGLAMLVMSTLAFPPPNVPNPALAHYNNTKAREVISPRMLRDMPIGTFGQKIEFLKLLEIYFRGCEEPQALSQRRSNIKCGSFKDHDILHKRYISTLRSSGPQRHRDQGLNDRRYLDFLDNVKKPFNLFRLIRAAFWMYTNEYQIVHEQLEIQGSRDGLMNEWNKIRTGGFCDLSVLADQNSGSKLLILPEPGPKLNEINEKWAKLRRVYRVNTPSNPEWRDTCDSPLVKWTTEKPKSNWILSRLREVLNWFLSWFKGSKGSRST